MHIKVNVHMHTLQATRYLHCLWIRNAISMRRTQHNALGPIHTVQRCAES
jgi:hypothetical protein